MGGMIEPVGFSADTGKYLMTGIRLVERFKGSIQDLRERGRITGLRSTTAEAGILSLKFLCRTFPHRVARRYQRKAHFSLGLHVIQSRASMPLPCQGRARGGSPDGWPVCAKRKCDRNIARNQKGGVSTHSVFVRPTDVYVHGVQLTCTGKQAVCSPQSPAPSPLNPSNSSNSQDVTTKLRIEISA